MTSKGYTPAQIQDAADRIVKEFRELCDYDYAKLTINMNRIRSSIEIVPEPHIKLWAQKRT